MFLLTLAATGRSSANIELEEERRGQWNLRHLQSNRYGPIVSADFPTYANSTDLVENACIKVKDGSAAEGQALILGDCEQGTNDGWRLDSARLFHSQLDDTMCIQAGRGRTARNGNVLRLFPCDATRKNQRFVYLRGIGIRPLFRQNLCVVWKGGLPEIDTDEILLNFCQDVGGRIEWDVDV